MATKPTCPKLRQSGVAEVDVEPHRRQCVDGRLQSQRCLHRLEENEAPVDRRQRHSYPNRSRLPKIPCGRRTSTTANTTKAPMFFNSTGIKRVEI